MTIKFCDQRPALVNLSFVDVKFDSAQDYEFTGTADYFLHDELVQSMISLRTNLAYSDFLGDIFRFSFFFDGRSSQASARAADLFG